jgi:DNA-binding phage protein
VEVTKLKNFNDAVRHAMKSQRLNVPEIAKEAGLSAQYIYELLDEDSKKRWNEDVQSKVASVLGIEVEYRVPQNETSVF